MTTMDALLSATQHIPRSPTWRYDLGETLAVQQRVVPAAQLDKTTRGLARYLRREHACRDEASRCRLQMRFPKTAAAVRLHRDADLRDLACTVEAWTLSRQAPQAIAERTSIDLSVLRRYRQYCFAVDDQIDDRSYILDFVLRPELRRPPLGRPARRRFVMKTLGYYCGAAALRDVFALERATLSKQWWGAQQTLWKLSAPAWLDSIARSLDEAESSSDQDPADLPRAIQQIIEQIQAQQSQPWPQSILEL